MENVLEYIGRTFMEDLGTKDTEECNTCGEEVLSQDQVEHMLDCSDDEEGERK